MENPELPPLAELEALLDREAAAVRCADFTGLEGLATRKQALIDALAGEPAPEEQALDRLRQKAARNASALEAARQGLRAARRRILELRQADRPETYDSAGRRQGLSPASGAVEKRA